MGTEEIRGDHSYASTHNNETSDGTPKGKVEPEEQGELIYQILCKSCGAAYKGETGRLFKARLNEHKKDVENAQKE